MKKTIFLFLFHLLLILPSAAGNIKGRVIDSQTKQAVDFCNVALYAKGNKTPLKSTATNAAGTFTLTDITAGTYTVKISFIGYTNIELPIRLTTEKPDADLHTISLVPDSKMLKEVEVVGQRSQIRFDVDKKVFTVDQNIAAAGGSASEILQNIPSVDVDTEGNVSLRNNSSVEVWINGRPSGLNEDNRAQILEQMPAESIESIEVITNPSAKYSPEGTAGIINIVLKKDRKAGYYGSISAGANTFGGVDGSANINYNSAKVDAYANIGVRNMRFPNQPDTQRESWNENGDTVILNQKNRGKMVGLGTFMRAGTTWHATSRDDLGVNLMAMIGKRDNHSTLKSFDGDNLLTRDRSSSSNEKHRMLNIALDYNHQFSKGENLSASVSYDNGKRNSSSDYLQVTLPDISSAQRQTDDNHDERWEIKIDYSKAFNDRFKLEAGYQGNINNRNSDVKTWDGTDKEHLVSNEKLNDLFKYQENIQALYATFTGKIEKFSFQLGLRGEYMHYTTRTIAYNNPEPGEKSYWRPYPSIFLAYSLPKGNEIQVNYTSRVRRPRGRQINPFRNVTDSTQISFGNPNLDPEFSNSLELNYIKNWEDHTLSASLYYRNTNGVIQNISYYDAPTIFSTYENITQSQNAGLELTAKNRLFKMLDLTTTVNLYYYNLKGFDYTYQNGSKEFNISYPGDKNFAWNARLMANMIFPKGFSAQVTGNYNSRQAVAQGKTYDNYSLDAGIRKSFFSRTFTIALSGRDLLDSRRRKTETWGNNFYQISNSRFAGRSVTLTFTYMFGTNNGNKQKNNRQQNDVMDSFGSDMMDF